MLPLSSLAPSGGVVASNNGNEAALPTQQPPPPNNPILTAYERWYHSTPFVTRFILSMQAVSYLFSWFVDPAFALANIPHFIVSRPYEVYRFLLSPLVNTSLISLLFAYLSFHEPGKRLEYSLGSTRFAVLCMLIGTMTNVAFFLSTIVHFYFNGGGSNQAHILLSSASGIWLVLFGIIAMECVQAPVGTQRKLFLWQVPVLYYPVALLLFFSFISASFSLAYCISMAVGYLYGFGYLDRIQLSHGKATAWEDGSSGSSSSASSFNWAGYLTRRDGWVSCHAATGSDAWMESASSMGGGGMTMPLFGTPGTSNVSSTTAAAAPSGSSRPVSVFKTGSSSGGSTNASGFSASAGRTLGRGGGGGESTTTGATTSSTSTTRRPGHHSAADARTARLQALEQRRSHYPDGGGGNSSGGGGTQQQSPAGP